MAGTTDWVRQYLAQQDAGLRAAFAQPAPAPAPIAFGAPSAQAANMAAPYPIRSTLTPAAIPDAQAAAPAPAASAGPGVLDYLAAAFPTVVAANAAARSDSAKAYNKGETARALGASARRAVTVPIAAVNDLVAPAVGGALSGVAGFFGGALSGASDGSVRKSAAPAAKRAAGTGPQGKYTPEQLAERASVVAGMQPTAAGRASDAAITPQDRALAFLDKVLQSPLTLGEYERAAGTLPAVAPLTTKPATAKDTLLGQTAQLSQQMFAQEVAAAQEMAKTDPIGARASVAKAQAAYYDRSQALSGVNVQQMANAELLRGAQQDGE